MHDDDVGSRSGAKQEELVARIQNETGAGLTASYVNGVGLKRVENSRVIDPRGDLGNASLRNCIIYGNTESVDFSGADLTGSEITLALVFRQNDKTLMMKVADFKNACLDDADLAIDYSYLKDMQRDASTDQLRREVTLSVMNRDVGGTPIGPLPTINSLGDRRAADPASCLFMFQWGH